MTFDAAIKVATVLVAAAGFVFGVVQYVQVQSVTATLPYLERKLAWCEEAVETASRIANADAIADEDIHRFRQMYWGVMGLIEKASISEAMIAFGDGLGTVEPGGPPPQDLRGKALQIAHACRRELSEEWSPSWSRR